MSTRCQVCEIELHEGPTSRDIARFERRVCGVCEPTLPDGVHAGVLDVVEVTTSAISITFDLPNGQRITHKTYKEK